MMVSKSRTRHFQSQQLQQVPQLKLKDWSYKPRRATYQLDVSRSDAGLVGMMGRGPVVPPPSPPPSPAPPMHHDEELMFGHGYEREGSRTPPLFAYHTYPAPEDLSYPLYPDPPPFGPNSIGGKQNNYQPVTLPSINDSLQSIKHRDYNNLLPAIDQNQGEDKTKKHVYEPVPKLDRTMTKLALHGPSFEFTPAVPSYFQSQDILSQRLQEANGRYLEGPKPDHSSPFRVGSPLSPRSWISSASRTREQQKAENDAWALQRQLERTSPADTAPKTVSPEEIHLCYNEIQKDPWYSLSAPEEKRDESEQDLWKFISLEQTYPEDADSGKDSNIINKRVLLHELDSSIDTLAKELTSNTGQDWSTSSSIVNNDTMPSYWNNISSVAVTSPFFDQPTQFTTNRPVTEDVYHEIQNFHQSASVPDVEDVQLRMASSPNNEQSFNSMGPTKPNVVVLKKQLYQEGSLTEEQALRIRELGTAILQRESDSQKLNMSKTEAGGVQSQYYDTMKLSEAVGRLNPFGNPKDSQRTWRVDDPSPASSKSRSRENKRKVLRVLIKGKEHLSCPDSGASENIMSEEFANHEGFHIRPRVKMLQLGNGKYVWSTGKVYTSVIVPGLPLSRTKQAFLVLPDCPVPLIMGLPFLEEAEIMSKNWHVLESCPVELKNISHLLWVGPPRNRMKCSFAGRDLIGVADTGSDLNMMSLECAKREGFDIDQRDSARRRIRFGDGSEAETVGQVYVYNLGFDWSQPETEAHDTSPSSPKDSPSNDAPSGVSEEDNYEAFHVFPGLPSDLIFGRDLLDRLNAFNLCPDLVSEHPKKRKRPDEVPVSELNILINVRRSIFSFWKRRKNNAGNPIPLDEMETHNDDWHAELGRRSIEEDRIKRLPQREQERARRAERRQVTEWDRLHARCLHCHPE